MGKREDQVKYNHGVTTGAFLMGLACFVGAWADNLGSFERALAIAVGGACGAIIAYLQQRPSK